MISVSSIPLRIRDNVDGDVWELVNNTYPTDGVTGAGFAGQGSTHLNTTTLSRHLNVGSKASPVWLPIAGGPDGPFTASGLLTTAQITGTSVGQLGHVDGVVIVPAFPTSTLPNTHTLIPLACSLSYTRVTASFAGGGLINLAYGGATGTPITSQVAAANLLNNAASKRASLTPTAGDTTAGYSQSLNLVSSVAHTNPGTAAGTLLWHVMFMAAY